MLRCIGSCFFTDTCISLEYPGLLEAVVNCTCLRLSPRFSSCLSWEKKIRSRLAPRRIPHCFWLYSLKAQGAGSLVHLCTFHVMNECSRRRALQPKLYGVELSCLPMLHGNMLRSPTLSLTCGIPKILSQIALWASHSVHQEHDSNRIPTFLDIEPRPVKRLKPVLYSCEERRRT